MRRYRLVFAFVIVVSASTLGYSYATAGAGDAISTYERQADLPADQRSPVVAPRSNVTVVAGHGVKSESAALVAFGPNGEVVYYNDTFHGYFDVDPVAGEAMTVEYVAERDYRGPGCDGKCTISVVERANLTTGEVTRVYGEVIPQDRGANWHDVDRVSDSELAVADIYRDELFVVNTTTELTTWSWSAKNDYPIAEGGPYPTDWTHLNDVERLADGRYVVSLRNQDQVAFVDPETGLQENWTLGAEGEHGILYEQHNPDYIPASRGGPAVVVADSLNDRVVEYQRENGEWTRSWVWSDAEMQWPRDADRLPNGHTLVADTNANRVVEVDQQGNVVWRIDVYAPYDVERLGTGDESSGGRSAVAADLDSRNAGDADGTGVSVAGYTPRKAFNGIVFIVPVWMTPLDVGLAALSVVVALAWAVVEYRNSSLSVSLHWPIRIR